MMDMVLAGLHLAGLGLIRLVCVGRKDVVHLLSALDWDREMKPGH